MNTNLKHKIGTTIAIDNQKVLNYFSKYILSNQQLNDAKKNSYWCIDDSIIVLKPSENKEKVFVQFHLNFLVNPSKNSISFEGKIWFMEFCKKYNSEIKNLRTGVVMPVSDGAIMSDIFTSETFRLAKHRANHPKD